MEDTQGIQDFGFPMGVNQHNIVFDIGGIYHLLLTSEPTKRKVVSMATTFFNPLGVVQPVIILFKIFFQRLCEARVSWNDLLTGEVLTGWNPLIFALKALELW